MSTRLHRRPQLRHADALPALKMMFWLLLVPIVLIVGYFAVVLNWNYSTGERAGWVQKLSRKGWLCKTWEGEMAMVSMPGAIPEKFLFTVRDDSVAESINRVMGKRVTCTTKRRSTAHQLFWRDTTLRYQRSSSRRDSTGAGSRRAQSACRTARRAGCISFDAAGPTVTIAVNPRAADSARNAPSKELNATVAIGVPFRCVYAVPAPTIISQDRRPAPSFELTQFTFDSRPRFRRARLR